MSALAPNPAWMWAGWALAVLAVCVLAAQRLREKKADSSSDLLAQRLARADCILWNARVTRVGAHYRWRFDNLAGALYTRLFGEAPSSTENKLWWRIDLVDQAEMDRRSSAALASAASGYEQEFRVGHRGHRFWLQERVSIRRVSDVEWDLVGIITDVTARHAAEEALRRSEAEALEILAKADCLVWRASVERTGDGLRWDGFQMPTTGLFVRMFGERTLAEDGKLWSRINAPDLAAMNARSSAAINDGATGYEQDFRVIREGQTLWLHEQASITPLGPNRWKLIGVITDVSARREAEEALAAEKERLAVTLRDMAEAVVTTDAAGVVLFANRAGGDLIGTDPIAMVNRPLEQVCRFESALSGSPWPFPLEEVLQQGVPVELPPNLRLRTADGNPCAVTGTWAPVRTTDGTVAGTVLVFRDVTERERLDREMARVSKLESIGVLAGGIAHDFNNVLTAIVGNVSLARMNAAGNTAIEEVLRDAEQAVFRARDLTQQLLTFARGGEPVRRAVLLPEIVREAAQFALQGSRARADCRLPDDLWPADADPAQVSRVVQNLVLNSAQAMPEGGVVSISARNTTLAGGRRPRGLRAGDYVCLSFADTGPGIQPEDVARIFDPYFTTKREGTGLGLAIVHSIVSRHRGWIEVDSRPGAGAVFHVWLPALRNARIATASTSGQPEKAGPLCGRVLLLDDEEAIRNIASALLTRFGLEVTAVADGREARRVFSEARASGRGFELVILDLTIPGGMGGLETLQALRRLDPGIRAIVSSGYSSDPVLADFQSHGFQGMVAKPYEIDCLRKVLERVLTGPGNGPVANADSGRLARSPGKTSESGTR